MQEPFLQFAAVLCVSLASLSAVLYWRTSHSYALQCASFYPPARPHSCPTVPKTVSTVICRRPNYSEVCRARRVREPLIRVGGAAYLALQSIATAPSVLQSASAAQIHRLPFLARYSNTSTLVTTSLAFMVSICHLPLTDSCLGHPVGAHHAA